MDYGWQLVMFTSLGVVLSYIVVVFIARYPFSQEYYIRIIADLAALVMCILIIYKRLYRANI